MDDGLSLVVTGEDAEDCDYAPPFVFRLCPRNGSALTSYICLPPKPKGGEKGDDEELMLELSKAECKAS